VGLSPPIPHPFLFSTPERCQQGKKIQLSEAQFPHLLKKKKKESYPLPTVLKVEHVHLSVQHLAQSSYQQTASPSL
jgi:catechol-2,3-dioxygenase